MPFDPKWEPPSFREKEHSYWWILCVILVIGVVVYLVMQQPAPASTLTEQKQAAVPAPSSEASAQAAPVYQSTAPLFDSKCTIAAGIVPGSIKKAGNKVTFTLKNSGKLLIEGSYFEALGLEKKAYRKNSESVAAGKEISYSVDLDDVSKEIGVAVNSFVVLPVQNSKACLNQRMIVIK